MKSWPKKPLGKVCELVNGAPFKPTDWDGTGLPIVRIQNLNDQTKPFNYTSKALPDKFRVRPGDTLLSWSGTPGTSFGCFRWDGPNGWLNQHIFNVHLSSEVLPPFFIYQVNSKLEEISGKAHGGVGLQHITKGALSSVDITVPPLAEQERIVKLLDEADELRKLRAQADSRTAALLPAFFDELFGDPGTNPMRWPVRPAGDLMLSCDYGTSKKANEESRGITVLRMGNVTTTGDIDLQNLKTVELSQAELDKQLLQPGDVLFNRTNSRDLVGKTGMWDGQCEAVAASYFIRIRFNPEIEHPQHFTSFMNQPFMKRRLMEMARGAVGQANINSQELKAIPVPVPPLPLQQTFARRVAEIRELEAAQAASRDRLDALFASLLHRAFAGELP